MNILFITKWLPYPPNCGSPIRNYNIIKRIAREHTIWLLSTTDETTRPEDVEQLQKICRVVRVVPRKIYYALEEPFRLLTYMLVGIPPDLRENQSKGMLKALNDLTSTIDFDLVQIEDSFMALLWDFLPQKLQHRTILTFHDVGFSQYQTFAKVEPSLKRRLRMSLHSRMMRRWEPAFAEHFNACITMSEVDKERLLDANPNLQISVIPNGIDTQQYPMLPHYDKKPRLMFVGNMGYRPNIDAMIFFCNQVLPIVKQTLSDVELSIVGLDPAEEVLQLEAEDIHVTGKVDDVRPFYQQSKVCIVPLRAGGGTRLKIPESMSLGRPVVSTSIGCEGLDVTDGENILIANDPEAFAESILKLLLDSDLYARIVQNGQRLVKDHYDWDIIAQRLLELYKTLK